MKTTCDNWPGCPCDSLAECAAAERYTLEQIAEACLLAEIPDSKFESIVIALQKQ